MGEMLTFIPHSKPVALEPLAGPTLRASLDEATQVALDAADRIIAVLDRMDGDADLEDGADDEPSLAAPENQGSQVTWLLGGDQDQEAEASEAALPEVAAETEVDPIVIGIFVRETPSFRAGRTHALLVAGVNDARTHGCAFTADIAFGCIRRPIRRHSCVRRSASVGKSIIWRWNSAGIIGARSSARWVSRSATRAKHGN